MATSYVDAAGATREAPTATLVTVLGALGVPIASPSDAELLLASPEGRPSRSPVVVVHDDLVALGSDDAGEALSPGSAVLIRFASGASATARVDADAQVRIRPSEHGLDAGVHDIDVEFGVGAPQRRYLVVGGERCAHGPHPERTWGVFAPISSLRDHRRVDHGAGDLSLLAELAATTIGLGGRVVATLPLTAVAPAEPSPYSPQTRRFWDERWVDPMWVAGRLGVATEVGARPALGTDRYEPAHAVDATRAALRAVLAAARPDGGLPDVVHAWSAEVPGVARWARWKAAMAAHGTDPSQWPQTVLAQVRDGSSTGSALDPDAVGFELFAQWAVSAQLESLGSRLRDSSSSLYLDLPVGVGAGSFDVWEAPESFAPGVSIGAPPDRFFPGGQSWGLAPLLPAASSANGHEYLRECLGRHMSVCGLLRIDHVMGFHRLFWVPEGGDATEGTYVRYPADELWAVTAALSVANDCGIVGEDLGTVPDEVRATLDRVGASGMFIGQDEVRDGMRLGRPVPSNVVAALNSHDLEPFAMWHAAETGTETSTEGSTETGTETRSEPEVVADAAPATVAGPDLADARSHLLAELAASAADVVLVAEQDLSLDDRRFNLPGAVGGDIWRLRARLSIDEFATGEGLGADARRVANDVDAWRRTERGHFPRTVPGWLDDDDVVSFHAGFHARLAERLGVHPFSAAGMFGAAAAVWAPRAWEVEVAGDFDGWSGTPLRRRLDGDVWEGYLPAALLGDRYKLRIRDSEGVWREKSDPFARSSELPPHNASIITADDPCESGWTDAAWVAGRADRHRAGVPMSIYEMHLGSWMRPPDGRTPTYAELAPLVVEHILDLGYTHVELMPIMEHPFGGSWGYHVTGYFAPTSRYGTPAEFGAFVDELHRNGIGVILDWVPAHFPDDVHGLADFDGQPLFEYGDPRMGRHPEWGSRVFDWGRPEVRAFLISSARWWIERYHIDGIRVDAVASMLYRSYGRAEGEWVPNVDGGNQNLEAVEFVCELTRQVHDADPGVLVIAEESTSWPGVTRPTSEGGLGFDLKWDLGWMHDMLVYLGREPVHRAWHQDDVTFRSMYAASERFCQPLSHDEVVHGKASLVSKMSGDDWQRRANLRLLYGHQYTTPGVPLMFMGGELAMNEEWNHEIELPWYLLEYPPHRGMRDWVRELNRLLRTLPALADPPDVGANFEWIDCADSANSVLVWLRRTADPAETLVVIANFTPRPHDIYEIGLPSGGWWKLLANSDSNRWGGSGYAVPAMVEGIERRHGQWAYSANITLSPLSILVLGRA